MYLREETCLEFFFIFTPLNIAKDMAQNTHGACRVVYLSIYIYRD
jgi:hypothetical protein